MFFFFFLQCLHIVRVLSITNDLKADVKSSIATVSGEVMIIAAAGYLLQDYSYAYTYLYISLDRQGPCPYKSVLYTSELGIWIITGGGRVQKLLLYEEKKLILLLL